MASTAQDQEMQAFYTAAKRSGLLGSDPEIAAWSKAAIRAGIIADAPAAKTSTAPRPSPPARPKAAATPPAPPRTKPAAVPRTFEEASISPFAPTAAQAGVTPRAGGQEPSGVLQWFSSLSNAYNGYLNELARQGKKIPSITADPAAHMRALPQAMQEAFAEGARHFGPEAVNPTHFRTMFNLQPGKAGRAEYNAAAALDYVSSALTDPTNIVMGPVGKGVSKALAPVGKVVGKVAAPVGRIAARATAKVAGTPLGREIASAAADLAPAAKTLTRWTRTLLLSRPSSAIANGIVNPVMQTTDELARHGIPLSTLETKETRTALGALRTYLKTGTATGDVAELLQHSPGILEAPAIAGGQAATKNPAFRLMSWGDQKAKVALYTSLKRGGLSPAEAARRVESAMMSYENIPKVFQEADRHGLLMFGSYMAASTKGFGGQLLTRPDLIARYPRFQQQMFSEFPGSREEFRKLPEFRRRPTTIPIGNGYFIDFARWHQWSDQFAQLQDALKNGLPKPGVPTLQEAGQKTFAGPLVGASVAESRLPKPPEGDLSPGWWRLIKNIFPAAGDTERIVQAVRQLPLSDRKTDEPQPILHAILQAGLGASIVRAELGPEKQRRQRETIGQRRMTAREFVSDLRQRKESGKVRNRFAGTFQGLQNSEEAKREYMDARKYFAAQRDSPLNSRAGHLTDDGREKITDAYLRLMAVTERYKALRRAEQDRAR